MVYILILLKNILSLAIPRTYLGGPWIFFGKGPGGSDSSDSWDGWDSCDQEINR